MTGYDVCKMFMALNNHFFGANYDYFHYKGEVSLKPETYDAKRQDEKHRYDRLAKKFHTKEELENFIVSNLIEAKKRMWVGLLFGGEADEVYVRWQGRTQSLRYGLISEIKKVMLDKESFNGLFKSEPGTHPDILKSYMRGDISLESFAILSMCVDFVSVLDKQLGDDRNWLIVKHKLLRYRPFIERLNISVSSFSKSLKTTIEEMGVHS